MKTDHRAVIRVLLLMSTFVDIVNTAQASLGCHQHQDGRLSCFSVEINSSLRINQTEAVKVCRTLNGTGRLAVISDEESQNFLTQALQRVLTSNSDSRRLYWIGAEFDLEGRNAMSWLNGESVGGKRITAFIQVISSTVDVLINGLNLLTIYKLLNKRKILSKKRLIHRNRCRTSLIILIRLIVARVSTKIRDKLQLFRISPNLVIIDRCICRHFVYLLVNYLLPQSNS